MILMNTASSLDDIITFFQNRKGQKNMDINCKRCLHKDVCKKYQDAMLNHSDDATSSLARDCENYFHAYKVYQCDSEAYYSGYALVAADDADEANEYVKDFKESDINNNFDSRGYSKISEHDLLESIVSSTCGIIEYGIRYTG